MTFVIDSHLNLPFTLRKLVNVARPLNCEALIDEFATRVRSVCEQQVRQGETFAGSRRMLDAQCRNSQKNPSLSTL
jgi:hypothetical protein